MAIQLLHTKRRGLCKLFLKSVTIHVDGLEKSDKRSESLSLKVFRWTSGCLMRSELRPMTPHQVHYPHLNCLKCHPLFLFSSTAHTTHICQGRLSLEPSLFLTLFSTAYWNGKCSDIGYFFLNNLYMFRNIYGTQRTDVDHN